MKNNFLIVGIILSGVGIGMIFYGYHQMQPTKFLPPPASVTDSQKYPKVLKFIVLSG